MAGVTPFPIKAKDRLHLLFVVSRPAGAGFLDPRADPKAVIDALEEHAPGRVTYEFLRPATLNALVERLDDKSKPPVDILHFDGHGAFREVSEKEAKEAPELYGRAILSEIHREHQLRGDPSSDKPVGIGFLVFEKEDGGVHCRSPPADLGDNLFRSRVMLVVLSACQTAMMGDENTRPYGERRRQADRHGMPDDPRHDSLGAGRDDADAVRSVLSRAGARFGHRRRRRQRARLSRSIIRSGMKSNAA